MNTTDMQHNPEIDAVALGVFEDKVIAGVDLTTLELFFRAKEDEIPGALETFVEVKELILRGALQKKDPELIAYDVELALFLYLSIEDIS